MNVLVEGFGPDARAVARFLAGEGATVRVADGSHHVEDTARLRDLGITVETGVDLDRNPGPADVAYLDVWTPEIAPRVQRLRAQGTRISSIGDLLLERWPGPTVGITGTAGKTTTTSLVASILRAGGSDVAVSAGARAGNLWPTGDLLDMLVGDAETSDRVLLLELTSSHLAFMHSSPAIAAIVSFWPDHLELHGDLESYRAAKGTIAAHQHADDTLVLNADDDSRGFAPGAQCPILEFSCQRRLRHGAYRSGSELVLAGFSDDEIRVGVPLDGATHPGNLVAAAAIAAAAGASPSEIAAGITNSSPLPYRGRPVGTIRGIPVVDDGMAATPAKARALLMGYADRSIILIAGGTGEAGGGSVHSAPAEIELLEQACDEIARAARVVVVFGPAGIRLASMLAERGVRLVATDTLEVAVATAAQVGDGEGAIVFSPLFPVALEDRVGFEALVTRFE